MDEMSKRMRSRRKELGLTLQEVADRADSTASTIRKWEAGDIQNMKVDKVKKVAKALDVSPMYLMGWEEDPTVIPHIESLPSFKASKYDDRRRKEIQKSIEKSRALKEKRRKQIRAEHSKALAKTTVELSKLMQEEKKTRVSIGNLNADFAVKVKDDAMVNARLYKDDRVLVSKTEEIEDGNIVAVVHKGEAILRRIYRYDNRIELRADNPTFPTINYEGEDKDKVIISGKAVAFIGKII